MAPFKQQRHRIGDYELAVVDQGGGFPVLLIHGLAGDHTAWTPQIESWSARHRVIAPDTRGAGRSTQRDEPVTLEQLADDFIALLGALDIARCHIVGRSMGGCIGQIIARKRPDLVQSLVLLASCATFDPLGRRSLANMREALLWRSSWEDHARHSVQNFVSQRFFNTERERLAAVEKIIASSDRLPACYVHQNHAVLAHDSLPWLHEITCPVYIMSGGQDPLGGPMATGWMVERLPQAEWDEFKECSHFFIMEEPERFMRNMDAWFTKHTPKSDRKAA
jgi:3-oxoadipate enol-lactonase